MTSLQIWTDKRPDGESLMDRLFSRLDGMYPGMWAGKFTGPDSIKNWKEAWAEAFYEDGITHDEIGAALRALRRLGGFPPSLPEFLSACRKPIDYDKAFHEAVHQMGVRRRPRPTVINGEVSYIFGQDSWSNPAIYWAAIAMGKDLDLKFHDVRNRWHFELDHVLSKPVKPVPRNTGLIAEPSPSKNPSPDEQENFSSVMKTVLSMFDEPPKEYPLTPAQIEDNERLERLRNEYKNQPKEG